MGKYSPSLSLSLSLCGARRSVIARRAGSVDTLRRPPFLFPLLSLSSIYRGLVGRARHTSILRPAGSARQLTLYFVPRASPGGRRQERRGVRSRPDINVMMTLPIRFLELAAGPGSSSWQVGEGFDAVLETFVSSLCWAIL